MNVLRTAVGAAGFRCLTGLRSRPWPLDPIDLTEVGAAVRLFVDKSASVLPGLSGPVAALPGQQRRSRLARSELGIGVTSQCWRKGMDMPESKGKRSAGGLV